MIFVHLMGDVDEVDELHEKQSQKQTESAIRVSAEKKPIAE